ncbi:unnamed protein product [Symbiodinium necroappetens]|uniref:GAF domain-containing protein n=1 Tax=Symbiodinium necroappetens TaxID=1628268 RepID=A0A812Z1P6_9DINO|nr:unnamed protein product [Symbiodinium necroappetens]
MLAVLRLYEHRTNIDMWSFLLEPLRNLVPCEEVKIVVRCIAPPQVSSLGAHDREARRRVIAVTTVDRWPPERIEGHAALTQRIQVIPSHEAVRRNWDRYEVVQSHCDSPSAGRATCRACNVGGGLRCLAAVPLFDAGGNVLAVAKFVNRRLWSPDGQQQPSLEFSQLDLTMLSAFSAIFACAIWQQSVNNRILPTLSRTCFVAFPVIHRLPLILSCRCWAPGNSIARRPDAILRHFVPPESSTLCYLR